jgi:PhnB protein
MPIKQLNPYLMFNGNAAEAIALYEKALGAKAENVQRFGDMPGGGADMPPALKSRVMHAVLSLGPGTIMMSDARPDDPQPTTSNTHITLDIDDLAEAKQKFEALSAGGKVTMPLQDTFWGATFGTLTDRFGINWMFNCEKKKS